jgi:hypothetical protein
MGTRAIINIKTGNRDSKALITIYRQMDGYPTGLGNDIATALRGKTVTNGYSDPTTQTNGIGCAAAMLIADLKDGCGNVYIYEIGSHDVGEEYTYTLWAEGPSLMLECAESDGAVLYKGKLDDFDGSAAEAKEV